MVFAQFHDVTDNKSRSVKSGLVKNAAPNLYDSFMTSAPGNSYLSRRTYPDTSVELVVAHVFLTSFTHVENYLLQLLTNL